MPGGGTGAWLNVVDGRTGAGAPDRLVGDEAVDGVVDGDDKFWEPKTGPGVVAHEPTALITSMLAKEVESCAKVRYVEDVSAKGDLTTEASDRAATASDGDVGLIAEDYMLPRLRLLVGAKGAVV